MSIAEHSQHHAHGARFKLSRLRIAIILTAGGMVVEFVGGFLANSLSLISDAGHMLTHLFALGTSYFAIILSLRPATKKKTYGFYRAEVLAAFINGIILILISAYLVYEAVIRAIRPEPVRVGEMLLVAGLGLIINGISTFLLARPSAGDLNIRSAFIHEIGDMVSSIAVVAAGLAIFFTRNYIVDPILAFFISVLIVIWAVKLLKESSDILLEATPRHLDIDKVILTIKSEVPGVHEVNHVHAWTIASSMYALTAHIVVDDCSISHASRTLQKINHLVKEKFRVEHTNIQFECAVKKEK